MASLQRPSLLLPRPAVPFAPDEGDPTWRVRRHFDDVLRRLARRDVSRLSARARAARARNLERLRAYAERGAFPRNEDFPGLLVPHFIDRAGTTCTVALVDAQRPGPMRLQSGADGLMASRSRERAGRRRPSDHRR
jgi:hypothetical protein